MCRAAQAARWRWGRTVRVDAAQQVLVQVHLVEALVRLVPVGEVLAGLAHPAMRRSTEGAGVSRGQGARAAVAAQRLISFCASASRPAALSAALTLPPSSGRKPWHRRRCPQPWLRRLSARQPGGAGRGSIGAAEPCWMPGTEGFPTRGTGEAAPLNAPAASLKGRQSASMPLQLTPSDRLLHCTP
jgi:hypothetical protein